MTPKQVGDSLGRVVEYKGERWFLIDVVKSRGEFGTRVRPRTFAIIGARGERLEVPPETIELVKTWEAKP